MVAPSSTAMGQALSGGLTSSGALVGSTAGAFVGSRVGSGVALAQAVTSRLTTSSRLKKLNHLLFILHSS